MIPKRVRAPLGRLRAVVRRIIIWSRVTRRIAGVSSSDHRILLHAVQNAPRTVWKNLDTWQFPSVERDCTVSSKGIGNFRIRAGTDDLFHCLPDQEPKVEKAIRSNLRSGDTFVDAGANIGYYTILASGLVGPSGWVIACEMMPDTARILRENVEINDRGNVVVVEAAIADSVGRVVEATRPLGTHGQASILYERGACRVSVGTTTLQQILLEHENIRLIKMDLEGAELLALRGLGSSIEKVEAIIFENRGDIGPAEYLTERGFRVTRLDRANAIAARPNVGMS